MKRIAVYVVTAVALLSGAVAAQEAKPHPFASHIADAQQRADEAKSLVVGFDDYTRLGDLARGDLPLAKAAAEEESAACLELAEAYKSQDKARIERARAAAQEREKARKVWQWRMQCRETQSRYAVEERGATWSAWLRSDALADVGRQVIDARRATFEAWGVYCEALVPGAPETATDALFDRAQLVQSECEIADTRWGWSYELWQFQQDPKVQSEALKAKFDEYWQVHERFVQLKRQQAAIDQQRREAERAKGRLMPALRHAHEVAVKARQEAEKRAREEAERKAKEEAERKALEKK